MKVPLERAGGKEKKRKEKRKHFQISVGNHCDSF